MLQTEEEIEQHLLPLAKVSSSPTRNTSADRHCIQFTNALVLLYLSPLTSSAYADIQLNIVLKHGKSPDYPYSN